MLISERGVVDKILKAVADPENASILMSVQKGSKAAQTISAQTGIPQSTVYRKLDELRQAGLIMTDKSEVVSGKRVDFVMVTFSQIRVLMEDGQFNVEIVPTTETANAKWLSLFRSD